MNSEYELFRAIARLALTLMLSVLTAIAVMAQTKSAQPSDPAAPKKEADKTPVLVAPEIDYRIGTGDVVEVQIEDAPELSRAYTVTAAGSFQMPFLGQVAAKGKTAEELARMIADGLRGEYLKNPNVSITLRQFTSQTYFIHGAVRNPGVFQIAGKPTLLRLISLCGGLAENHGSTAFIFREIKSDAPADPAAQPQGTSTETQRGATDSAKPAEEGLLTAGVKADESAKYEMIKVNFSSLYRGKFDKNITLEPGDIVNIPAVSVFFVAGEVRAPGAFQLKEGTTLRQAISLAQGVTVKAKAGKGIIFREDPDTGVRQEIPVNIGAVMSGKHQDVEILANDVILVPNSRTRTVGSTLLMGMGGVVPSLMLRFPY
ncbi:MAG TPA: polysaccharide biosynthesis/export family protein [Blastocatellia bacterium]|nr:polysaccharide biosynthesis/export family protein [Blastocatellia bacterium]